MADFGIRISRFGLDVKTAADFQLILNSSWPSLKVHFAGSITYTTDGTNNTTLYTHSLGYTPCFQVFDDLAFTPAVGTTYDPSTGIFCNSTTIYANQSAGTRTVYLYVYRQDLNTAYTAPIVNTVSIASGSVSADEGLKVSKIGKSTSSADLRDYAIHSGTQELGLGQVATTTVIPPATNWVVTHNLGYKPAWLLFQAGASLSGGSFDTTKMSSYNLVRTTADNNSITFLGAQAPLNGAYSAIIFKDPVLLV